MGWLSGVSLTCFTTSYAVALGLEATRLWFRSGVRGALLVAFASLGLLTHSIFLFNEAGSGSSTPLSSWFHWYVLAAWVLAASYLYLIWTRPHVSVGLFLLPLVLALIGAAYGFHQDKTPFPESEASQIWGWVHGGSLLLGTVVVLIGFVAGALYVVQAWRLKHKLPPPRRVRLPSLEWLERVNSRCMILSAPLLAIGVLSGVLVNAIHHARQSPLAAIEWDDPIVWSSAALLAWLAAAGLFEAVYRPARRGGKVAYLTVGSFAFLLLVLLVTLLVPGSHGAGR